MSGAVPFLAAEPLIVELAIRTGIVALLLTVLLLVVAFFARLGLVRRVRRRGDVEEAWMPLLLSAMRGEVPDGARPLSRWERAPVLALWNQLADTVEGGGYDHLVAFGHRVGFADAARHLLAHRDAAARLAAASTLGRLRDMRSIRPLQELLTHPNLALRAQAARALIRIDAAAGLRFAAPLVAQWDDCHPAAAVAVLSPAGRARAAVAVAVELQATDDPGRQVRLVKVLDGLRQPSGLDAVRALLRSVENPEVIAACIHVLAEHRDPSDLELVRGFADHPASFVRVQVVSAMGRFRLQDEDFFVEKLGDRDWWVRYRAAHVLVALPQLAPGYLERLSATHPDRYARDALQQALTERAAA